MCLTFDVILPYEKQVKIWVVQEECAAYVLVAGESWLRQVATRTDARGIVTTYTYNLYGDVTAIAYSDGTPTVTYAYDALGRQAQTTDAVGTTTFGYNVYGELETEAISGLYAKMLTLSGTRALDNPFRFSSEFSDDSLGLVYYNYRHYNPIDGWWIGRDRDPSAPNAVLKEKNRARREVLLYSFSLHSPLYISDALGLDVYLIRGGDVAPNK